MSVPIVGTQYDTVSLSVIPHDPWAVGAYADGGYANLNAARASFPHARILGIAVREGTIARSGDFEPQCLPPAYAPQFHRQAKASLPAGELPVVYGALQQWLPDTLRELAAAGIPRHEYLVWSAHLLTPRRAHICSPDTCGSFDGIRADMTQWTFTYDNLNLDASAVGPGVYLPPPPPPDPMRYSRYAGAPGFERTRNNGKKQMVIERDIVQRYDHLRQHAHQNSVELDSLRKYELHFLLGRLYRVIYYDDRYRRRTDAEIQTAWHMPGAWRPYRFARLRARYNGSTVHD